jgi:hypothetical protein
VPEELRELRLKNLKYCNRGTIPDEELRELALKDLENYA